MRIRGIGAAPAWRRIVCLAGGGVRGRINVGPYQEPAMQIKVNAAETPVTDALHQRVVDRVTRALRHVGHTVTRVEVHLRDDKRGRRGPDDRRCLIEARLAGREPMVVQASGRDLYRTIDRAAEKLARALSRAVQRRSAA
jgi:ribosomal subunit interface protein